MRLNTFALAALAACSVFAAGAEAVLPAPAAMLTVVALTDFHGALLPDRGEGGAAVVSSYLKILRNQAKGPVVVVDGGDLFQGTLESNLAEGAPVIRFYNAIGVTAVALGNHEFDFGPEGEKSVPVDPSDDPQGALKARIREANFPVLAANVVDARGETPVWLKRSLVVEDGGLRIGIIGAATPDTPNTTVRANTRGLTFLPPVEPVRAEAERLRRDERVDAVVVAFHGGGGCKDNANQDDLGSCEKGEAFDLVRALPRGLVDVVVGGHTHKGVAKRVGDTVVLQSFSRGKQIAWAEVRAGERPRVAGFTPVRHPARFLGVDVEPDGGVERLLKPDLDRVRAIKETPLHVHAEERIPRSYDRESALGNLVADTLRGVAGADVGMTNGGGLRADLASGPLNYGHVFEVLPFDNRVALITTDGATVARMVGLGHSGSHGSLSWSGLTFKAQDCAVEAIEVRGQPLDPSRTYRIATNDYLAGGGSGFDGLGLRPEQVEVLWNGPFILRDVTARELTSWGRRLRSRDFFDPAAPRQAVSGKCRVPSL